MNNEEKILQILETIAGDVGELKKGQTSLENRMGNMENRMDGLEKGQDILARQVNTLTGDVQEIRQSQVSMENELTEKIRALFDGRSINQDYFSTIKNTLARIEKEQNFQSSLLIDTRKKQEDQETELRLLRAEK